jgi:hypothetical protein
MSEVKPASEPAAAAASATAAAKVEPTAYESNKQLAVMVDMVDGKFQLPAETIAYMDEVRVICQRAARNLTGEATRGVALDHGQLNAALQLLQQVKNKACDAAIIGAETKKRAAASNWAAGEVAKRPAT